MEQKVYQPMLRKPAKKAKLNSSPTGFYHYTVTYRDGYQHLVTGTTSPVGYCNRQNCRHQSPEEATACFRDYIQNEKGGVLPNGQRLEENMDKRLVLIVNAE